MKRIILPVLICCLLILLATFSYAVDGYSFALEYDGTIKVNEAKNGNVKLIGTNGPTYTNVRIKVDITGPSTPTILAYDSTGVQHDIAQLGYWGPDAGFAVQGTFTNDTPVVATFSKAGDYTIVLSLINVANNNEVIATRSINLTVEADTVQDTTNTITNTVNNVIGNTVGNTTTNTVSNVVNNIINNVDNTVTEIPKTGTGLFEYALCFVITAATIGIGYVLIRSNREV